MNGLYKTCLIVTIVHSNAFAEPRRLHLILFTRMLTLWGLPEVAGSRWVVLAGSSSLWWPGPPQVAPPPQSHPASHPGWWTAALAHGSPGRVAVWLWFRSDIIKHHFTSYHFSLSVRWFCNLDSHDFFSDHIIHYMHSLKDKKCHKIAKLTV